MDLLERENPPDVKAKSNMVDKPKPRVFIGCSVEGLSIAKIIQLTLEHSTRTVVWHQGVFGLSKGTLETLVEKVHEFDYAMLVLTPDDIVYERDERKKGARDNVLFELGLFMGALGRERTFIICDRDVKLPTDLAGVTPVYFSVADRTDIVSALGPVCTKLEIEMGLL